MGQRASAPNVENGTYLYGSIMWMERAKEEATLHVRGLSADDWCCLRDIRLRALRDSPDAFLSTATDEEAFDASAWAMRAPRRAVAFLGDQPVGMIGWWSDPSADDRLQLVGMWVDPVARGGSVAQHLIDYVRIRVATPDCKRLWLAVFRNNTPAVRCYLRAGFVEARDCPDFR